MCIPVDFFYDEDCYHHGAGSEILTSLRSCAGWSSVLLSYALNACISQLNCHDVDGCNQFAGSGTLTGLRISAGLSWSHRYCKLTPPDVCVSQFNSYGEGCWDHVAGSEILTSLHSCAGLSWFHWYYRR